MANIFLTGATGFVGSWVAAQLTSRGHKVTCLVRKTSNLRWIVELQVDILTGSLFHPETYGEALKKSDYVFHVAGVTKAFSRTDYFKGNADATNCLLDAVYRTNPTVKKFLFVSSQAAVGPSPSAEKIDETYPCRPLTDYGKSKLDSERLVQQYEDKIPVTIVRPPVVYGQRDTDVLNIFKNINKGINLQVGNIDQNVSLIHVEDLAAGIIDAGLSDQTTGNTYFLSNNQSYYWSEVARKIGEILDKKFVTIKVPFKIAWVTAAAIEMFYFLRKKPTILNRQKMEEVKAPYWTVSPAKAQADFGFCSKILLNSGLEKTAAWYQDAGWL